MAAAPTVGEPPASGAPVFDKSHCRLSVLHGQHEWRLPGARETPNDGADVPAAAISDMLRGHSRPLARRGRAGQLSFSPSSQQQYLLTQRLRL